MLDMINPKSLPRRKNNDMGAKCKFKELARSASKICSRNVQHLGTHTLNEQSEEYLDYDEWPVEKCIAACANNENCTYFDMQLNQQKDEQAAAYN